MQVYRLVASAVYLEKSLSYCIYDAITAMKTSDRNIFIAVGFLEQLAHLS
ncbi:MAG: hypothetical protein KME32_06135 [Mojavia pulchra JT2-VF2]|uniref:Uncharacterized protein n=1 Tax=Mojavia pulchra JT2-VF2 TaxID=287848 RepID=A0A951PX72_9NOST|nr:hypothetical protein [Mojavia pulchra JT2-VF2]